ncbi:hypothetical protein H4R35_002581 [Dimargaris xerosporica]|nr:hypothetical protein H4R35_002581 [Dimargaris xerosporica]
MDVGQPLTHYQPLDTKGFRERVDSHTSRLETRYHGELRVVLGMLEIAMGELANVLSTHLDRVREMAQMDIAESLGTIYRREQHQDAIQAQLLMFVGVMKSAYSELFEALELPSTESSTDSIVTTTRQESPAHEVKPETT